MCKKTHKGCKHLDYSENYIDCKIVEMDGYKWWERQNPPYEGAPVKVQFCGKGRGRINGIFQCINKDEMSCFEE
jgi:hypothetical protein